MNEHKALQALMRNRPGSATPEFGAKPLPEALTKTPEEQAREEGIENVVRFLSKLMGGDQLAHPERFVDELGRMRYEDFRNIMDHINGLLRKIPIRTSSGRWGDKRGLFTEQIMLGHKAKTTAEEEYDLADFYFLPPEESELLLQKQFKEIQEVAKSDNPDKAEHLAQAMYNSLAYLHPFRDGNGRTGRLSYFLLSPDIPKNPATLKEDIVATISSRNSEEVLMLEYHDELNGQAIKDLLEKAGFEFQGNEYRPAYRNRYNSPGFDDRYVNFVAAWRIFTPEERQYIREEVLYGRKLRYIEQRTTSGNASENRRRGP